MFDLKKFDLKGFRENKLKLTQKDLGDRLGLGQDQISRLEKNPDQMTLELLLSLCQVSGMTPDQVLSYKLPAPQALSMPDAFRDLRDWRNLTVSYLAARRKEMEGDAELAIAKQYLRQLDGLIQAFTSKPVVAVLGLSDAGKSRFINTITGADKLAAQWTPTTSITVYLKHIQDKPEWMKEEAWVFRPGKGDDRGWDFRRYNDRAYCEEWKVAGGGVEVLKEYGTRQGGRGLSGDAGSAVVYLDSPVLQNCDLVDLPGFGTGDREEDEAQAARAREHADVIIYLSPANGFLRGVDLQFLKNAIRDLAPVTTGGQTDKRLSPLANLFVVASHAHAVDGGDPSALREILDKGCERLYSQISEEVWQQKAEMGGAPKDAYTSAELRSRFFTFSLEHAGLRRDLEEALVETLTALPGLLAVKADAAVKAFKTEARTSLDLELSRVRAILEERDSVVRDLAEHEKHRPEHQRRLNEAKMRVIEEIRRLNAETKREFHRWFEREMTPEKIKVMVDRYSSKKDAQEFLPGNVNDKIYNEVQRLLKRGSEELDTVLKGYLETYRASVEAVSKISFQGTSIPFDFRGAFTASLAGASVLGGLGLWAATLGNLGGYILVAKGVSLLSALGISISGGTAAVTAAVSLIGGPITLGIALALGIAALVKWLFGESWQSRMAKKMYEQLRESGVENRYARDVIDKFWRDTESGFEQVVRSMDNKFEEHVSHMKQLLVSNDQEQLVSLAEKLQTLRDFFGGVPWTVSL